MDLRRIVMTLCAVLVVSTAADAGKDKILLLDKDGLPQGVVSVKLESGSAKGKLELPPLPATIDTGDGQFEATLYKAYLVNSVDPAIEISLGDVFPSAKSKAKLKSPIKGDLSGLGLDRLVVVAFSRDGLSSFDVLTAEFGTN